MILKRNFPQGQQKQVANNQNAILKLLKEDDMTFTEIATELKKSKTTISKHLKTLVSDKDISTVLTDNRQIKYHLNHKPSDLIYGEIGSPYYGVVIVVAILVLLFFYLFIL